MAPEMRDEGKGLLGERMRRESEEPVSAKGAVALCIGARGGSAEREGRPYQCARMELPGDCSASAAMRGVMPFPSQSHAPDGSGILAADAANGRRAPVYNDLVGYSGKPDSARIVEPSVVLASLPWSGLRCSCPVGGGGGGEPNVKERRV